MCAQLDMPHHFAALVLARVPSVHDLANEMGRSTRYWSNPEKTNTDERPFALGSAQAPEEAWATTGPSFYGLLFSQLLRRLPLEASRSLVFPFYSFPGRKRGEFLPAPISPDSLPPAASPALEGEGFGDFGAGVHTTY